MKFLYNLLLIVLLAFSGCQSTPDSESSDMETQNLANATSFGTMTDGQEVLIYMLRNTSGMEVHITNYGGIITAIHVPDRDGVMGNVTLGYDSLEKYLEGSPYFGVSPGDMLTGLQKGNLR